MPTAARRLTTHQKQVLIQVLLAFPGQRVALEYAEGSADAADYALDFLAIFRALNWDVEGPRQLEPAPLHEPCLKLIAARPHLAGCAEGLRDALRVYGIEVELVSDQDGRMREGGFLFSVR